jgi:hypothetical protein
MMMQNQKVVAATLADGACFILEHIIMSLSVLVVCVSGGVVNFCSSFAEPPASLE